MPDPDPEGRWNLGLGLPIQWPVFLGLTHSLAPGRRPILVHPPSVPCPPLYPDCDLLTSRLPLAPDLCCQNPRPGEPTQLSPQEPPSGLVGSQPLLGDPAGSDSGGQMTSGDSANGTELTPRTSPTGSICHVPGNGCHRFPARLLSSPQMCADQLEPQLRLLYSEGRPLAASSNHLGTLATSEASCSVLI